MNANAYATTIRDFNNETITSDEALASCADVDEEAVLVSLLLSGPEELRAKTVEDETFSDWAQNNKDLFSERREDWVAARKAIEDDDNFSYPE